MSFYDFGPEDIINTYILATPSYTVELNGNAVTGSVYLEKQFLNSALYNRLFYGFSDKEGGFVEDTGPFTASIDFVDAEQGATNKQLYESILMLYDHYNIVDSDYTSQVTGSDTTRFRVITIPEIYYDREILTGSFTASDVDNNGDTRYICDNGRGGLVLGEPTIGSNTVAYYRMEQLTSSVTFGLEDSGPNNADAQAFGHITYQQDGLRGSGIIISSASQGSYLELSAALPYINPGSNKLVSGTIEWWFKAAHAADWNISDGSHNLFFLRLRCRASAPNANYNLLLLHKNTSGDLVLQSIQSGSGASAAVAFTGGADWHHFAITFNSSSNQAKLYIDGVEKLSTTFGNWFEGDPAGRFWIGNQSETNVQTFSGTFDEIRISNIVRDIPNTWNTYSNKFPVSGSSNLVGNIFYSEGLAVLKGGGLNVESPSNDFGEVSPTNHKWRISLKGVHRIPVKIFRCRAPAGQLNASTNPSFYQFLTGTTATFRNEKEIVMDPPTTYVTAIGLYNDDYKLVGLAKLAQPIKKEEGQDILFRLRLDF